jgi:hypothetical protein
MRGLVSILVVWVLAGVTLAQRSPDAADEIRGVQLTVESATLPEADRKEITRLFHDKTYETVDEIQERLRDALQVLGYFNASVSVPRVSFVKEKRGGKIADIRVAVEEGLRYQLGEIRFRSGTVFPGDRLREAVPIQTGEVVNTEKMREGIQNLRKLYGSQGYINLTLVPATASDDSRQTVDVTFDLDEGRVFHFGPLVLDGPEPHAGAGKALLEAWKTLLGKPYNPALLEQWYFENGANLPRGKHTWESLETSQDEASQVVTVRLWFP